MRKSKVIQFAHEKRHRGGLIEYSLAEWRVGEGHAIKIDNATGERKKIRVPKWVKDIAEAR